MNKITIKQLQELYAANKLVVPTYQRNYVWSSTKKKDLILAILDKEEAIPNLTFHIQEEIWNIVDGQQRIFSILEYLRGEISITLNDTDRWSTTKDWIGTYKKLPCCEAFLDFAFDYKTTTKPRTSFVRLQNGQPLNEAEKRHAADCELNSYLKWLTEHYDGLWSVCNFNNDRFKTYEVLSACVYLACKGVSVKTQKQLREFSDSFNSKEEGEGCETVNRLLTFMQTQIKSKQKFLSSANFRAVFCALKFEEGHNRLNQFEGTLDDFLSTCATLNSLKNRNRMGEEMDQKEVFLIAYREFVQLRLAA